MNLHTIGEKFKDLSGQLCIVYIKIKYTGLLKAAYLLLSLSAFHQVAVKPKNRKPHRCAE